MMSFVKFSMVGMAYAARNPAESAAWFAEHFGFQVGPDIGWYVSTRHPDHSYLSLDFIRADHETWPPAARGRDVAGMLLAFLVADVDAEFERLTAEGLDIVLPPVTEPWGQRRFQVAGPDGLLVEVLQPVPPDPQWIAEQDLT